MKFYEFLKRFILHENTSDVYSIFENKIGYKFKNRKLLAFALTHSSRESNNKTAHSHFERMEFLGDSVLGLIVSNFLFNDYPLNSEGELTKKKSKLVSRKFLSTKANELGLQNFIKLSRISDSSGAKTILGNALEALIAAIYLDGGINAADTFIKKFILNDFKDFLTDELLMNYKSLIQEYTQKHFHSVPIYKVINVDGPDHKKIFTVSISINGKVISAGTGKNKKSAEQQAAKKACEQIGLLKK